MAIALIMGWSAEPRMKSIVILPDGPAVAVKSRSTPTYLPAAPAFTAAWMASKFYSTTFPLMSTLNTRCPALVQYQSRKYSRTW